MKGDQIKIMKVNEFIKPSGPYQNRYEGRNNRNFNNHYSNNYNSSNTLIIQVHRVTITEAAILIIETMILMILNLT
jgi:hypothetical protein